MKGEMISHYRVTDQIGRGGMGIVYRAEDTKLDRTVALKLLPPHALASEDDRARFYREARAAAALSHPNIAHIYEIDEAVVEGGESRPFIAMEFIDGESLGQRITKGPLPLKDAISIATQIAEGLKAAHEKQIVHRDIKSGNVMLTKDGVPKILDFGLAKTTASTKLTQMGSTLGTVAYMSPEQARGEEVDRRSDIWSLGVILYEMITGQLPFRGDYEQAVVYGILNENPESMTVLRAGVPMALDGIMTKLLSKDPSLRYQHVDELPADLKAIDLGSAIHTSRLSTTTIQTGTPLSPVGFHGSRRLAWLLPAVAIGALVVGFAAAALILRPGEVVEQPPRTYYAIDPEQVEGLKNAKSLVSAYLSPDGKRIAFNADSRLWIRSLDNLRAVPLPGSEGAGPGFEWSPDSKSIAFAAGGSYRRIVLENNQITTIGDAGAGGWWEFRRDGSIAGMSGNTIIGPIATGVKPAPITVEVPGLQASGFAEIPNLGGFLVIRDDSLTGRQIAHASSDAFQDLVALPPETNAQDLVLTSFGHLLFTVEDESRRRTEIWGIALDLKSLEVTAGPSMVVSNAKDPSASVDGKLVYMQAGEADSIEVVVFDYSGRELSKQTSGLVGASAPEISPDGRYVAIDVNTSSNDQNIWIMDRDLGGFFQLTFDVGNPWRPAWSPDSRNIAFQSRASTAAEADIFVQSIESGSKAIRLVSGADNDWGPSWSHDGEWVLYTHEAEAGGFAEIWRVRADGTADPEPVVAERFSAMFPSVSPDGRYVAYASDRSGQFDAFVSRYPDGDRHARVTNRGVGWPKWRGDRIVFQDQTTGDLMSARVTTAPTFRAESPQTVLTQEQVKAPFDVGGTFLWDVSADGSEIVQIRDRAAGATPRVIAIENWRKIVNL